MSLSRTYPKQGVFWGVTRLQGGLGGVKGPPNQLPSPRWVCPPQTPPSDAPPPSPVAAMGPPRTLSLVLLLLGAAMAEKGGGAPPPPGGTGREGPGGVIGECSGWGAGPVAALILTDVALSLALAGAAFWAGGRGRAPPRPHPPEQDSAYQELQGARADLYSELKR
ncbi:paired mesoderm homeobox protein 2B-like isoform X2 [Pseudopipra pipra]|uniref:paired mesoderm homeobox protein 2B-like isoform X2 n=1 Tax=Pseudopipra pipra TaxID=415032 RepID=UPI003138E401